MRRFASFLSLGLFSASFLINSMPARCAEVSKPDERLLKTISYDGGYQRLHNVADDISKQTGVKVWCGKSLEDWRVRDIPVIVYAHDITLIKLLQTIASATHCQLAEVESDADKPKTYRIYRTRKMEAELEGAFSTREDANLAKASWAWDALVAFANMPDNNYKLPDPPANIPPWEKARLSNINMEHIKLVGKVLASLGPEGKEKALTGEQITLAVGNDPLRRQLYSYASRQMMQRFPFVSTERLHVADESISSSTINILISKSDNPSSNCGFNYGLPFTLTSDDGQMRGRTCWDSSPTELAEALTSVKGLNLPPMPDVSSAFADKEDAPDPSLKPIKTDEDWNLPSLQTKVKIELPKTVKDPKRQDVLKELSTNTGFAIVIEDFLSHKDVTYSRANSDFGTDPTVASVLKNLDKTDWNHLQWSIDEKAKLLVGKQPDWRKYHLNLIPESLIAGINEKRLGAGAELDDMTPLIQLTRQQFEEWISCSPDFPGWNLFMAEQERVLWQLYDALGPEEKALAKSESGLPLSTIDPIWLTDFCMQALVESSRGSLHMNTTDESSREQKRTDALTNPEVTKTLTMYVKQQPVDRWDIWQLGGGVLPSYTSKSKGPKKHTYSIQLRSDEEGKPPALASTWYGVAFPLFTMEKERQLASSK